MTRFDTPSTNGHLYFIAILEHSLNLLKLYFPSRDRTSARKGHRRIYLTALFADPDIDLSNRFSNLEVNDTNKLADFVA
jgi:hypothetical protein